MKRVLVVVLVILLVSSVGIVLLDRLRWGIPEPPIAPAEVVSAWKSPSSPQGFPPELSGKVALQAYGNRGSRQESMTFNLHEGEWIDVLATSDEFVYFGVEQAGARCFKLMCRYNELSTGEGWDGSDFDVFAPLFGKVLYEQQDTKTEEGIEFTTAVRLFAWAGAQTYYLQFMNFHPHEATEVSYQVYQVATTLGWGDSYKELQPWLNELHRLHASGKISQPEYDKATAEWLEQFQ